MQCRKQWDKNRIFSAAAVKSPTVCYHYFTNILIGYQVPNCKTPAHKLYTKFHWDEEKMHSFNSKYLRIYVTLCEDSEWQDEHFEDYLDCLVRVHQQTASGVQNYNDCSPVTSTCKSWREQSKVYYLLNLYEGCWIFPADVSSDSSEENVSQVPLKRSGKQSVGSSGIQPL